MVTVFMHQPICVVAFSDMAGASTRQRCHIQIWSFAAHHELPSEEYAFSRHYKGNLLLFMQFLHSHMMQNLNHNDILHIPTSIRHCNNPLNNKYLGPRQKEGKRINCNQYKMNPIS